MNSVLNTLENSQTEAYSNSSTSVTEDRLYHSSLVTQHQDMINQYALCQSEAYSTASSSVTDDRLYHSSLVTQHQDMINQYALCLTRLRKAAEIARILRQENASLRSINIELNNRLSLLLQSSVQKHFLSSDYDQNPVPSELVNGFRSLYIGGDQNEEMSDASPTSVIRGMDVGRATLPKSVSVRSDGYLKMNQAGATTKTRSVNRPRNVSPLGRTQKVYVGGGKKEEPVMLEVYNQGMFKTELCNKWEETGTCPYGDHCQFAHGMHELRPVIRHPRYKTEVCRMVLAGDVCPYGHRCHFRHALTDEEKSFMARLNHRAIKLGR
ncbi:zinc finger CCCH domain-containing protein 15-like isoform X1 [Tripterygium wilfordii]|uniref:zinc finger CCCH domain-containing protein 15-like isoform X1 n=1 Tax=Tripterygium wilfordii TaxID=458696 RepID=UPI0018F7FBED|nr:zinc finger CCCH domain-containing protein 15-like isoform X1 [Tripterygium wilfordii]